ncbi:hypothetical protein K7X08_026537 [Anisodus acutangulus]|uniref:Uncharacterized protein n=1 Tax=Anisodus acutangulus TaxID=402998 RepID=A0A9Q1LQA8_9SOLA|nr:hypothetical protein K7X08_026537 [Anisodus acutangulus]
MEQSWNILIAFVEEKRLRRSEKDKKKKLETFKAHVVQPTAEVPRPANEVNKFEVPRLADEVDEVDIPSEVVDIVKVELPNPAIDFPMPNAKVVKENNVLAQIISEEVVETSETDVFFD